MNYIDLQPRKVMELLSGIWDFITTARKGYGLTQDSKEAERWVRMAAEQGVAGAQNGMGIFHLNGEGVIKDDEQAVNWFKAAADQSNELARNNLRLLGHIK